MHVSPSPDFKKTILNQRGSLLSEQKTQFFAGFVLGQAIFGSMRNRRNSWIFFGQDGYNALFKI